jgi:hypothetical protein
MVREWTTSQELEAHSTRRARFNPERKAFSFLRDSSWSAKRFSRLARFKLERKAFFASCAIQAGAQSVFRVLRDSNKKAAREIGRPFSLCAEHLRQLDGDSPFHNPMEVKWQRRPRRRITPAPQPPETQNPCDTINAKVTKTNEIPIRR